MSQAVTAVETADKSAESILKAKHITPQHRGIASAKVAEARKMLSTPMADELSEEIRQEALEKLDILTGKVKGASSYKALNLISGLTNSERSLLEQIFNRVINCYSEEESEQFMNMTLQVLSDSLDEK